MKHTKRFTLIFVLLAAALPLCAASMASGAETQSPSKTGWKFERTVRIVCPWGAGGGADATLQPMARLLRGILGQDVEVVHVTGGGGAYGADYVYKQPADGYTFLLGTQSIFMQDMQAMTSMNFKTEFVPVARLVHAINIIAGSKRAMDEKGYHTFAEMSAYAKREPFDVNIGMLTSTGLDGAAAKQALRGLDVLDVPYPSGAEMNAALARGDIDIMIAGTEELQGLMATGEVVPLLALCERRLKRYPDLPCSAELGIDSTLGPSRGLFARKGTPQGAIDALAAAIEEATRTKEWQDFLEKSSYDERPSFAGPEGFAENCEADYRALSDYLKAEGTRRINYYGK